MTKAEKGSPKDIANRIKAKGLQRLRWYCQMCQKQCRDENGFKCHTLTDGHKRMMQVFSDNSSSILDNYSRDFEKTVLEMVARRFGTKRVLANVVYNEYIQDRHHVHMNATIWETLTDFVMYLGKTNKCNIDHTERGWYIAYIDRSPEALRRAEEAERKEKMEMDDEDRSQRHIEKQMQRARELADAAQAKRESEIAANPDSTSAEPAEIDPEKLKFSFAPIAAPAAKTASLSELLKGGSSDASSRNGASSASSFSNVFATSDSSSSSRKESSNGSSSSSSSSSGAQKRKISALDEIMAAEQEAKQHNKSARIENWIVVGLVVRIINKSLSNGQYYKQKGIVVAVSNKFVADVQVLDSDDVLRLDQEHLETVLPALDQSVYIVNGQYRGGIARMLELIPDKYRARVRIESGSNSGRTIEADYEDVCKFDPTVLLRSTSSSSSSHSSSSRYA
ncbi:KIN protein [Capsaspora owczarzaki ATCC 30864]|nr:KIN protein [Capsaspora owczarzaki ATCC 30864]|eukprot:XP_004344284.1 KIN protein [Capsaspora owczarzaki ATCC 30864]